MKCRKDLKDQSELSHVEFLHVFHIARAPTVRRSVWEKARICRNAGEAVMDDRLLQTIVCGKEDQVESWLPKNGEWW